MPGALKSSEYLLPAGPFGKHLLQACMHRKQQAAVFDYLDLLGAFWEKTFTEERLQQLKKQVPVVLARLERLLPTWEANMNRHMMLHLCESIHRHGPCWAWSMSGFERLRVRLTKWTTQISHPKAIVVNSWKAFITSRKAMPDRARDLHQLSDEHSNGGSASLPFHYIPVTFDRNTYQLQLPSFVTNITSTPISSTDSRGYKRFGRTASIGTQSCTCTTASFQGSIVLSMLPVRAWTMDSFGTDSCKISLQKVFLHPPRSSY